MNQEIQFNATAMFEFFDPWDCSNSMANLGPRAAELTWDCAMRVAGCHTEWLLSPTLSEAAEIVNEWAKSTGAWDETERAGWTDIECLALFVQNVSSDLRELGADDMDLGELAVEQAERAERDEDVTCTWLTLNADASVTGVWYGGM